MTHEKWWEDYMVPSRVKAGEIIFRQGDPGMSFYVVGEGQVVITKQQPGCPPVILGYREAGDMFGEVSLIAESPRTASAAAVRETTLLGLTREAFWQLMQSDKEFQRVVIHTVIDRLLIADDRRVEAEIWERHLFERFSNLAGEHERMAEVMQLRQETMHFIIHDLRNPIGLATTAMDMIRMADDYDADSETARFVDIAIGGLNRLLGLVDSLLDVERLGEGGDELDREMTDLAGLIRDAAAQNQPFAQATTIRLETDLPPEGSLPGLYLDKIRIERVLTNLIDNALKFTSLEGTVTVGARREAEQVIVFVNDTGRGIPPAQRERVFDRFVQTEEGQKSRGFGLGLAFCRSAVEAHGGKIRVEDGENGVGAKFVFTLPLSLPEEQEK